MALKGLTLFPPKGLPRTDMAGIGFAVSPTKAQEGDGVTRKDPPRNLGVTGPAGCDLGVARV